MSEAEEKQSWLNRTVLGVGLTSLFSDWSHETATAVLPAFLAAIGAGPAWLGAIEGGADRPSSCAKLIAGHYTHRFKTRKPLAVFGYAITAVGTAPFALASHAYQLLVGRGCSRPRTVCRPRRASPSACTRSTTCSTLAQPTRAAGSAIAFRNENWFWLRATRLQESRRFYFAWERIRFRC